VGELCQVVQLLCHQGRLRCCETRDAAWFRVTRNLRAGRRQSKLDSVPRFPKLWDPGFQDPRKMLMDEGGLVL
jgi:hypothetical protein